MTETHREISDIDAARSGDEAAFARLVGPYRRELKAHCYRLSGSLHDADDLLQDSLLRAWKGLDSFEGRSSLRTWLYKITTNACLNELASKKRELPSDPGPPTWLEPCPDELWQDTHGPEARTSARESVALAFLTALQRLAPKERAVLLLHDVIGWSAAECAELLDSSVPAINSALQRARHAIDESRVIDREPSRELLDRYIRAWESSDLSGLVALLHEDATLAMPPLPDWLRGRAVIDASMRAMVFTPDSKYRVLEIHANGRPALALYRLEGGEYRPYAIQLLDWDVASLKSLTAFLDTRLFASFGLAPKL